MWRVTLTHTQMMTTGEFFFLENPKFVYTYHAPASNDSVHSISGAMQSTV